MLHAKEFGKPSFGKKIVASLASFTLLLGMIAAGVVANPTRAQAIIPGAIHSPGGYEVNSTVSGGIYYLGDRTTATWDHIHGNWNGIKDLVQPVQGVPVYIQLFDEDGSASPIYYTLSGGPQGTPYPSTWSVAFQPWVDARGVTHTFDANPLSAERIRVWADPEWLAANGYDVSYQEAQGAIRRGVGSNVTLFTGWNSGPHEIINWNIVLKKATDYSRFANASVDGSFPIAQVGNAGSHNTFKGQVYLDRSLYPLTPYPTMQGNDVALANVRMVAVFQMPDGSIEKRYTYTNANGQYAFKAPNAWRMGQTTGFHTQQALSTDKLIVGIDDPRYTDRFNVWSPFKDDVFAFLGTSPRFATGFATKLDVGSTNTKLDRRGSSLSGYEYWGEQVDFALSPKPVEIRTLPFNNTDKPALPGMTAHTEAGLWMPEYGPFKISWTDASGTVLKTCGPINVNPATGLLPDCPFTVPANLTEAKVYQATVYVLNNSGAVLDDVGLGAMTSFVAVPWTSDYPVGAPLVEYAGGYEKAKVPGGTVLATDHFTYAVEPSTPLPAGLTVDGATGAVTGTPQAGTAGTYNIKMVASSTWSGGVETSSYIKPLYIIDPTIAPATAIEATAYTGALTTEGLPLGTGYALTSTTTSGWPDGLTYSSTTDGAGSLTGTPTLGTAQTDPYVIPVTYTITRPNPDGAGTVSQTLTVNRDFFVKQPLAITVNYPDGTAGTLYAGNAVVPTITDGTEPYTFEITGLPDGLTYDTATGKVSGTPTKPGEYNVTIKVTDASGQTKTTTDTISIALAAPTITAPADNAVVGPKPTVTGVALPGASVTVTAGGKTCTTQADSVSGAYSCTFTEALPTNASTEFSVTQTANNITSQPATVTANVDATAPNPPVVTGPALTNDTTPTITGTGGEPGDTVEVWLGNTKITCDPAAVVTTVDGVNKWECTPNAPIGNDGTYVVTAKLTDPQGNVSDASAPYDLVLDTATGPTTISQPTANATVGGQPAIKGTAEPGATVTLKIGETAIACANAPIKADTLGSWTCNPTSNLPEGTNQTITATAVDTLGNPPSSATVTVSVDTTASAAPTISAPADGSVTNTAPTEAKGTGEPGDKITATLVKPDGSTVVLCTDVLVPSSGEWSCPIPAGTFPATDDGAKPYKVEATQKDPVGNVSPTATSTFTYDTVAPATGPVITDSTPSTTNDTTPDIKGTGIDGSTIHVYDGGVEIACANAPVVVSVGAWTCTPTAELSEATHQITAKQADSAGNLSPVSNTYPITIDKTAPVVAVTEPALTNTKLPTIKGTASEAANITLTADGNPVTCQENPVKPNSEGVWTCTVTSDLNEGANSVVATATDPAGNAGVSDAFTVTVDTQASVAPVIDPFTKPTNDNTPTITGSGVSGDKVTVTAKLPDGSTKSCGPVEVVDGAWSCTPVDGWADGTYTLTATQQDPAGNVSPVSEAVSLTIDTKIDKPVISGPAAGTTVAPLQPVTGSAEPGSTVTVTSNGQPVTCKDAPITADENGAWTCTPTAPLASGDLVATATDAAGNSATSDPVAITVDASASAAPTISAPADGSVTKTAPTEAKGTGEPGDKITATLVKPDGSTVVLCTDVLVPSSGEWSCPIPSDTFPATDDGAKPYKVEATQKDPVGNVSPTATSTFTYDTVAPAVTFAEITDPVTDNTPALSGTAEAGSMVTVTRPDPDGGEPLVVCGPVEATGGLWSCIAAVLPEGSTVLTATAVDGAGNKASATQTAAVDSKTDVPVITPFDGVQTTDKPTISGSAEPGATVTLVGKDAEGNPVTVTCDPVAVADENGAWSCKPSSALPQGETVLTATATDAAGNTASSTPVSVTVDSKTDVPVINAVPVGTDPKPTISGTAEPGATVTLAGKDAEGNPVTVTCDPAAVADENGAWSCKPASNLPVGVTSVTATATDAHGNVASSVPVSVTVNAPLKVDTAAGTVLYPDGTVGSTYPDTNPPVVSGGVGPYTYSATGLPTGLVIDAVTGVVSGVPSVAVTDAEVTVTVTDAEGNSVTFTDKVTVASIAKPVITSPAQPDASTPAEVGQTPAVSGSGVVGAKVTVHDKDNNVVCTVDAVPSDGVWSCTTSALALGANTLTATQTVIGADNNEYSSNSDPVSLNVSDVLTISGGSTTGGNAIYPDGTVGVTYSDPNKPNVSGGVGPYTFALSEGSVPGLTLGADGLFTGTPTQVGSFDVKVTVTDKAGNTASFTDTIVIRPAAPVITGPGAGATVGGTPEVSGTGTTGDLVTVTRPNPAGGEPIVVCGPVAVVEGSWSCTPASALPEGSVKLTATATDPNVPSVLSVPSNEVTVSVDTTAPVITAVDNVSVPEDVDITPISVVVDDPEATVSVAGLPDGVSYNSETGKIEGKPSTPGVSTVTITATDAAGNSATSTFTFTVTDATAPVAPVITQPEAGATSVAGTAEPNATVTVTLPDGTSQEVTADGDGNWEVTGITALKPGDVVKATQTDAAGNTSPEAEVTVADTTAPVAPVITQPDGPATSVTPEISGTAAEAGGTVTVTNADGETVCTATVQADKSWSCTPASDKPLAEGDNELTATHTDAAGNTSGPSTPVNVPVDTTGPALTVTSPTEGSTTNDSTPTFAGTTEPGASVVVMDGTTLVCETSAGSTGAWSCTPDAALEDATYKVTVTASDLFGNPTSQDVNFTVNTSAPDLVVSEPTAGSTTSDATPEISGTAETGAVVTVKDKDGNTVCGPVTATDGSWSCTPESDLPEGEQTLTVTATNSLGNTATETVKFTVDTTAPEPPVITEPDGPATSVTPEISGTAAEAGGTVTVTNADGETVCTATVQADKSWSCTPASDKPLAEGDNELTATHTDAAGNTSGPSTAVNVPVDTTAPVAPVITQPEAGATSVAGTAGPNATVTVTLPDGTSQEVTADGDGNWEVTGITALKPGDVVKATQTDAAGNTSPEAEVTVTAPTPAKPAAPVVDTATPDTIGGTADAGTTVTVKDKDGNTLCTATVGEDGKWSCEPSPKPAVDDVVTVTADKDGVASDPTTATVTAPTPAKPAAPVVDTATPDTIGGTADAGTTVTVKDKDGNTLCTATVGEDGKWSCEPSPKPAVDDVVTVTADKDGVASDPTTATVTAPTPAKPAAPSITGPTNGATTNDSTPTISGTGDAGSTVTVKDGDKTVCTATVGEDGKWSCTPTTPLADGSHDLTATASNDGGTSDPSTTVTVNVDTEAPAKPAITGPANGSTTNDNTPTVSGTGENGATVEVFVDGKSVTCTPAPVVVKDGKWSCTVTSELGTGDHTITAKQTDPAGNTSPVSDETKITVVAPAPDAPAITGPEDGSLTKDDTPTISGTGEPGATVTVKDGDKTVCTATVGEDGKWSCTPTKPLGDGEHTLTATQTPEGGTESAPSAGVTVTVDTTAPAKPAITGPADGATGVNGSDPITGTGEPGATVEVKDGDKTVCTATVQEDKTWSCTPTKPLADGDHTLTATQTDPAGNTSPASDPVKVTVGTVAPEPPTTPTINSPEPNPTNDSTPTFDGTGTPGDTVTVKDGDKQICTTTVKADGTWSCTPADGLTDGKHDITATATDPETGLSSDPSEPVSVTVDTTGPATPGIDSEQANLPSITGTGEAGSTVTVTDKEGNKVCETKVKADGTWTCTPATPLHPGTHDLTATATDSLGNPSKPTSGKVTVPEPSVVKYQISGHVFLDANQDGFLDAGETDISAVTVQLWKDGVKVAETQTHSPYVFEDLAAGEYVVKVLDGPALTGLVPTSYPSMETPVLVSAASMAADFGFWYIDDVEPGDPSASPSAKPSQAGKGLPQTGFDVSGLAPAAALSVLALGGLLLTVSRRRK